MKHFRNLQSLLAAASIKPEASDRLSIVHKDAPSQQKGEKRNQKDNVLHRLFEAAELDPDKIEHILRSENLTEMNLQEIAGQVFVLLFQSSSSAIVSDVAEGEDTTGSRIRSNRALKVLLHILPVLARELASFYLNSLHELLSRSLANIEFACSVGSAQPLLHWLPRLLPAIEKSFQPSFSSLSTTNAREDPSPQV